jgi:hypothetical protein
MTADIKDLKKRHNLTWTGAAVLAELVARADEAGVAEISILALAEELDTHRNTVSGALDALVSGGLVAQRSRGRWGLTEMQHSPETVQSTEMQQSPGTVQSTEMQHSPETVQRTDSVQSEAVAEHDQRESGQPEERDADENCASEALAGREVAEDRLVDCQYRPAVGRQRHVDLPSLGGRGALNVNPEETQEENDQESTLTGLLRVPEGPLNPPYSPPLSPVGEWEALTAGVLSDPDTKQIYDETLGSVKDLRDRLIAGDPFEPASGRLAARLAALNYESVPSAVAAPWQDIDPPAGYAWSWLVDPTKLDEYDRQRLLAIHQLGRDHWHACVARQLSWRAEWEYINAPEGAAVREPQPLQGYFRDWDVPRAYRRSDDVRDAEQRVLGLYEETPQMQFNTDLARFKGLGPMVSRAFTEQKDRRGGIRDFDEFEERFLMRDYVQAEGTIGEYMYRQVLQSRRNLIRR